MRKLRRILVVMLIGMTISVGAFGQKNSNDNRPPKEPSKVKEREKPPPSNNKQNNSNKPRKP